MAGMWYTLCPVLDWLGLIVRFSSGGRSRSWSEVAVEELRTCKLPDVGLDSSCALWLR